MSTTEQRGKPADLIVKEVEVARLLRAWEYLNTEQKEDLIYLAQSIANRNRRELRSQKAFSRAA
jgi:hypothetical protein